MPVTTLSSINEGHTGFVTLTFIDENNNAVVPTSFTYKVNDLITGQNLASGNVSPVGNSTYTLELASTVNIIVNNSHAAEEHVLTINARYESNKYVTGDYHFLVNNLEFL